MKSKSKSKQIKLIVPIIVNNENEEQGQKLIRPKPINSKQIIEDINKSNKNNIFKSNENKTYTSEGSCSYSK